MLSIEQDSTERNRKDSEARRIRAIRRKRMESGRSYVTVDLPVELIELVDQVKSTRRLVGRAPVVEEALREYLTKHDRA